MLLISITVGQYIFVVLSHTIYHHWLWQPTKLTQGLNRFLISHCSHLGVTGQCTASVCSWPEAQFRCNVMSDLTLMAPQCFSNVSLRGQMKRLSAVEVESTWARHGSLHESIWIWAPNQYFESLCSSIVCWSSMIIFFVSVLLMVWHFEDYILCIVFWLYFVTGWKSCYSFPMLLYIANTSSILCSWQYCSLPFFR